MKYHSHHSVSVAAVKHVDTDKIKRTVIQGLLDTIPLHVLCKLFNLKFINPMSDSSAQVLLKDPKSPEAQEIISLMDAQMCKFKAEIDI